MIQNIKRIIVHGKCADGMAAAIILYDALGVEPEFMRHNSEEYLTLEASEGMLFCDIAPAQDKQQEFISAGAVVLDHHCSTKAVVDAFGENGVYADENNDPGISGAWLAYREIWQPLCRLPQPSFENMVHLVGIYDTWRRLHVDWNKAAAQVCALNFYSWDYWRNKLNKKDYNYFNELGVGKMIYQARQSKIAKIVDTAKYFEYSGYKVAIFRDIDRFISEVADYFRDKGFNVVVGFSYNDTLIYFAVRTDGSIDASDLVSCVSGGGHARAAGFSVVADSGACIIFEDIFKDYIDFFKENI